MSRTIASSVLLVAGIVVCAGFVMQRRALARYGKQPRPRQMGYWNCAEWFDNKLGMRLFLQGDALLSWGLMVVLFIMGYLAGRKG